MGPPSQVLLKASRLAVPALVVSAEKAADSGMAVLHSYEVHRQETIVFDACKYEVTFLSAETTFTSLPLHDALLAFVYISWEAARYDLRLGPVGLPGYLLVFEGVTHLEFPRRESWGGPLQSILWRSRTKECLKLNFSLGTYPNRSSALEFLSRKRVRQF